MDLGLYDSDTGASIESVKVVDVSDLSKDRDRALMVFAEAKRGRIVQLRFPYGSDDGCGMRVHYFFDEPAGVAMIAEDEDRFGFAPGALIAAVFANAPVN